MPTETRYWLLTCRPQREPDAVAHLGALGYWAWSPMEARYRKRSRHVKGKSDRIWFTTAALPGYVIVGFEPTGPAWSRMLDARNHRPSLGLRPLMVYDDPVRVHPCDVERLQIIEREQWLNPPGYHASQHRRREYDPGDMVEVIDGPLTGYTAKVARIVDGYAEIDFSILGRSVRLAQDTLARVG